MRPGKGKQFIHMSAWAKPHPHHQTVARPANALSCAQGLGLLHITGIINDIPPTAVSRSVAAVAHGTHWQFELSSPGNICPKTVSADVSEAIVKLYSQLAV